jgi:predicted metal-dependent hydrolase
MQQIIEEAHDFFEETHLREKAADERAQAIINAINAASKKQAEALERGLRDIADALRRR